jgi:predicted transposase YdaD
MTKKKIQNPHDKLFRASMQYPEVAREFLELHLPEAIKKGLDFDSIITCPNTFIDQDLKLLQSDVLLKATVFNEEAYLYILAEHQSKPDPLMPLRLIKYMTKIWDFHCQQSGAKKSLPLPVIVPLVFFTGKGHYTAARTLSDLCGNQAEAMRNILHAPYSLIDVNTIPEDKLTSRMWAGTMEFIMRNRFKQHLGHEIQKIAHNINHLFLEKNGALVLELLSYIVDIDDEHRNIQELVDMMHNQLSPNVENEIMSLAEKLRDEGRNEGGLKKELEIAQRMIDEGVDPVFIVKMTKLSLDQVKALKKKN